MSSLTSSWHSSSLTFVSPQNHQQASIRSLTTSQPRFVLPSRSKMAKIGFIVLAAFLVLIVIGFVIGDTTTPQPGTGRPKPRSKLSLQKKRRPGTGPLSKLRLDESSTTATLEETGLDSSVTEIEGLFNPNGEDRIEELVDPTEATTARPVKTKKALRSQHPTPERPVQDPSFPIPEGCEECDIPSCKSPPESSCAAGLVLDRCSCCFICGSGEGNRCFNATIPNLSYNTDVGMCGTELSCILRSDLEPNEPREALCECRDRRLVCGNDKQTYISECKIHEAAHSNPGLAVATWGPCVSAPWMPSSIENASVAEGEDVSLSCEVKAFPSPIIHWEFISDESSGSKILPGDDSSVVVVVRGGPEQTMSTSWIQIIGVTNQRQGTYYCVAKNSEGVTRSAAIVMIQKDGILPLNRGN